MDCEEIRIPISHDNKSQHKKRRGRPPGSTIKNSYVLTSSTLFDTSRRIHGSHEQSECDNSDKSTRRTRRQHSDDYIRRKFLYEESSGSEFLQPDGSKKSKKKQHHGQMNGNYQSKSRRGRPPKNRNSKEDCRFMPVDLLSQDDFDGLMRSDIFDFCLTSPFKVSSKRPLDLTGLDLLSEIAPVKLRKKSRVHNELPVMSNDIVSDYLTDCNLDELGIASDELPDFDFPDGQNGLPNVEGLEGLAAAENYLYESGESADFLIDTPNLLSSIQNPISNATTATSRTVPQRRRKSPLRPLDSLDYQLPCFTTTNSESCPIEYPQLILNNQEESYSGNSKSLDDPITDLDLSVDFNQIPFQLDSSFKSSCLDNFSTIPINTNDLLPGVNCNSTSVNKRSIKINRRSRKTKEDASVKAPVQQPAGAPVKPGNNKRPVAPPHRPSILRSVVHKSSVPPVGSIVKDAAKQSTESFANLTRNLSKYTNHRPEKASDLIFHRLKSGQQHPEPKQQQSKEFPSKLLSSSQTASSVLMQKKQVIPSVETVSEPIGNELVINAPPIIPTKTKLMNSNPKSIKIQELNDELVSGFQRVVHEDEYEDVEYDVYRIPAKGYSSSQCFVDYEPQIKERREKVITQDMIDQRPRQAIRKYYNSLKKHLNKQDRQSVNFKSCWSQSNQDSDKVLSNEPVSNQCNDLDTEKSTISRIPSMVEPISRQPQKHYKVVVVDDPSGFQEAVLVSHPPFPSTLPGNSTLKSNSPKYIHNSMVSTNTAVRNIKGRSRRSLLKEFRAGVEDQLRNAKQLCE